MRLSELSGILRSTRGDIQLAVVYDGEKNYDLEDGCSVEYAIKHYGDKELKQLQAFEDQIIITI